MAWVVWSRSCNLYVFQFAQVLGYFGIYNRLRSARNCDRVETQQVRGQFTHFFVLNFHQDILLSFLDQVKEYVLATTSNLPFQFFHTKLLPEEELHSSHLQFPQRSQLIFFTIQNTFYFISCSFNIFASELIFVFQEQLDVVNVPWVFLGDFVQFVSILQNSVTGNDSKLPDHQVAKVYIKASGVEPGTGTVESVVERSRHDLGDDRGGLSVRVVGVRRSEGEGGGPQDGGIVDAEPRPRGPVVVEADHRVGWPQGQISRVLDRGRSGAVVDWRPEGERSRSPGVPDGAEDVDVPAVDVEAGVHLVQGRVPQHTDDVKLVRKPETAHVQLALSNLLDVLHFQSLAAEDAEASSPRDEGELAGHRGEKLGTLRSLGTVLSHSFLQTFLT